MKMTGILTTVQKKNLWEYNYVVDNNSILEALMRPFWDWLVKLIPRWWSCNALTVIGLAINIATTLILVYYSPDAKQTVPAWVYLVCAVGVWVYQLLDQLDGRQARRTKTDGPLEDLYDHGCDSVSQIAIVLGSCVAMRMGEQLNWMLVSACLGSVLFYVAQWQWKITGVFQCYEIDVTEGHYSIIGVYLISAVFGDIVWNTHLPVFGIEVKMLPLAFCIVGGVLHLRKDLMLIVRDGNKNGSSKLFPLFPMTLVLALEILLPALTSNQLYTKYPCLYLILFGLVAAKVTIRLLIAVMTKSDIELLCFSLVGPGLLVLNHIFNNMVNEYYVLLLCLVIVSIDLCRYTTLVAWDVCGELNIYSFSIAQKPLASGRNTKRWNGCSS